MNTPMTHTVILEQDPETGDLIMPLSDEILAQAGWVPGDTLDWQVQDNGSIIVSKVENES